MILRRMRYSFWAAIPVLSLALVPSLVTRQVLAVGGLNYVDANANPFAGTVNIGPDTAFVLTTPPTTPPEIQPGVDNKWFGRSVSTNGAIAAGGQVYEAGVGAEDAPEVVQTITGLTPGTSYDLYAAYWTDDDENWTLRAGVASGNLTLYNFTGPYGVVPLPDAKAGINAAGAIWDTLPPANTTTSPFTEGPLGATPDPTDRRMLLGKAGTVVADVNGEAKVFMDDLPQSTLGGGAGRRSWIDGVAYVEANTQITLTASISAAGLITVNNPTARGFQIKSYSIDSGAGALDATIWAGSTIAGHRDGPLNGGNSSFDTDEWSVTAPATPASTPFATQLAEAEDATGGSTGGTLTSGGSLNFGAAWRRSRYNDVRINLTLSDDTLVTLIPTYASPVVAVTDFNGDGTTDLADYQTMLNNLQTNVSGLTRVEAFTRGDATDDRVINFNDFAVFRAAYNLAHGAGAFEQLAAQVPEPATLGLIAIAGAALTFMRRRRTAAYAAAVVVSLAVARQSHAVPFLAIDVDDRQADAVAGPPGPNTVVGFSSFQIPGTGTGTVASATGTVNGYTITMTAITAAGVAGGAIDDRDRATPTTAPNLNQLYDDFIFATSTTLGSGLNLEISGGTLQPNTQYSFSLYAFDTGSTPAPQPRTSDWTDGNYFNATMFTSSFSGANSPTTDEQYKFTSIVKTDATGKLLIKARSTVAANAVFVNGFELANPDELTLQVNPLTGATSIRNDQTGSFNMSYYEIRSANGSLSSAGWTALDDAEPGPDPVGSGWDKVPASNSSLLSEVNLQSMLTLAPGASASLGNAFQAGFPQDLRFFYAGPNETMLRSGIVKFVSAPAGISGDYNNNGVVDAADYVVWRNTNGTSTSLPNDSTPGTVTSADYDVWKANFGKTPGSGSLEGGGVPEPATWLLGLAVMFNISMFGRARRS
jgi:hypothetical protein